MGQLYNGSKPFFITFCGHFFSTHVELVAVFGRALRKSFGRAVHCKSSSRQKKAGLRAFRFRPSRGN
jgi:hypothetical protein